MKKLLSSIVAALPLLLGACADSGGMQNFGAPTAAVDPHNDPNAYRLQQDQYECRQIAEQGSGGTLMQGAKGAAIGGLVGAAGGAAVGAIAGNAGKGAAIGAAVGGIGAGAQQGYSAQSDKNRIYKNCLRNRGHNVLD
ncbi:MAG: glycine zipper family protein [Gammaproteobacteria bacterium]